MYLYIIRNYLSLMLHIAYFLSDVMSMEIILVQLHFYLHSNQQVWQMLPWKYIIIQYIYASKHSYFDSLKLTSKSKSSLKWIPAAAPLVTGDGRFTLAEDSWMTLKKLYCLLIYLTIDCKWCPKNNVIFSMFSFQNWHLSGTS